MMKLESKLRNDNFFVMRTPRLPITELLNLETDIQQLRLALRNWISRPEVEEALYFASPSLLQRIPKWLEDPSSKQGKKIEQALLKYMIRMTTRSTPFGLFSGVCIGEVNSKSDLVSDDLGNDRRKTRIDLEYLGKVKKYVIENNYDNKAMKYYLNPSIYFVGGECRYIESYTSERSNQYRLSSIEVDKHIQEILKICSVIRSFSEISELFSSNFPEYQVEDIEIYVKQLIKDLVLLPNIPLPLTGESPDVSFLNSLENIEKNNISDSISDVIENLNKLDFQKNKSIDEYKKTLHTLKKLPIDVDESKLFQVDSYRQFITNTLSSELLDSISKKLIILARLSFKRERPLEDFVKKFNERFEGQFVSLSRIVDEETGISLSNQSGYEAPLIAGLKLSRQYGKSIVESSKTPIEKIISQKVLDLNETKDGCIKLSSTELLSQMEKIDVEKYLPSSFAAMVSLYKDDGSDLVHLKGAYGPSAASLIGRFCHLDENLRSKMRAHLKLEESHSESSIFAEIAHAPAGREGNVIARPHLREYEIVFMAESSLPKENQIMVDDLYVFIEGGVAKLWSKRLNKRVIPRLSSAHNYSARSLSIYKFLCMLQKQDGNYPLPSFQSVFRDSTIIPRIMLDNIVLSERAWRIPRNKLVNLLNSNEEYSLELEALLVEFELTRYVSFSVGDNVLIIDLKNPSMLSVLLAETKDYTTLLVKEVLASMYQSMVSSKQGSSAYANEIIIPYFNSASAVLDTHIENPINKIETSEDSRRFIPGSEWMNIKVYSGNSIVENLLRDKIYPIVKRLCQKNIIKKWFFIRYNDPDFHLRLRFNGNPAELYTQVLPELNNVLRPLLDTNEIHKVELFTYEKEVERYGGESCIQLVESLFAFDSVLVSKSLALVKELGESVRWRVNLLKADRLLDLFGYNLEEKIELVSRLRTGFGNEFNETAVLRKQLGIQYRKFDDDITLDFQSINSNYVAASKSDTWCDNTRLSILAVVDEWEHSVAPIVGSILETYTDSNKNTCSKDSLLGSILHMHSNRMFKAYGREQEYVIYDFLRRTYFSYRAIQPKNKRIESV